MNEQEQVVVSKTEFPDSIEFEARGKSKHKVKIYTDLLRVSVTKAKIQHAKESLDFWEEIMNEEKSK